MTKGRSISLDMPKYLLDQIQQRAVLNSRSRNAELRYLVDMGLRYAGDDEISVEIPGRTETPWAQAIARIHTDVFQALLERSRTHHRGVGTEIIRLASFAMEEMVRRDLEIIAALMQRQGRVAPSSPQTAAT